MLIFHYFTFFQSFIEVNVPSCGNADAVSAKSLLTSEEMAP
jgi:hypothetical protein